MTCCVSDCDRPVYIKSRQLCSMHYNRWSRHGSPTATTTPGGPRCRIDACERPVFVKARQLCAVHYDRLRDHGDPEAVVSRIVGDHDARFASKTDRTGECWLWLGNCNPGGYAVFSVKPKNLLAHRWAYERYVGPIPPGLQIDHLCGVHSCVRPDHLEPVTQDENLRRQNAALGRLDRGCSVAGCDDVHRCFGMCNTHFLRWKKAGRPALTQ